MKRVSAFVLACGVVATSTLACTPKPDMANPVAEDFLAALSAGDIDAASQLTDSPTSTKEILDATYKGMQAEGLHTDLKRVDNKDSLATAEFSMDWDLTRDRNYAYDSSMTLTKSNGEWKVRFQPNVMHPKLGSNQHLELRAIPAKKASVISADGASILEPGTVYRVLINPSEAGSSVSGVAARVAGAINSAHERDKAVPSVDQQELAKNLADAKGKYSVALIGEREGKALQDELRGVPGVSFNEEAAMVRTDPGFAPDIMSRVEKIVQEDLDGAAGWKVAAVNQNGAELDALEKQDPQLAPAVRVSLDHTIQQAAQEAVDLRQGSKAMMVAVRPSTGEVLAVAQTGEADKDGDVALTGQFPPGSTFKIITASAGISHQGLTPGSTVPCPGTMEVGPRIVNNYNTFSRGMTSLEDAFAQSCNTTFADISSRLAPGDLQDMGKQFGLGMDYKIPGLDTITGSIPRGDEFIERVDEGFGQGRDLASPFGMALVSATAATGKTTVPQLISNHQTEVNGELKQPDPAVISQLQQMMRSVVTSGTARGMGQTGGEIHAKTGEAEVNGGSHAWFTGYRSDDIAFCTLIVLGGGSESAVAVTDHFFKRVDEIRAQERGEAPGV